VAQRLAKAIQASLVRKLVVRMVSYRIPRATAAFGRWRSQPEEAKWRGREREDLLS